MKTMRMLPAACFAGGVMCGAVLMSLMVISGKEDRVMEVMDHAGGSGEQDSEPCDHDDEAGCADGDRSRAPVPPEKVKGKRAESF